MNDMLFIILGSIFFIISHFLIFLAGFARGFSINAEELRRMLKEVDNEDKENR